MRLTLALLVLSYGNIRPIISVSNISQGELSIAINLIPRHHSKHQDSKQKSNFCLNHTGARPPDSSEEPQMNFYPGLQDADCRDGPLLGLSFYQGIHEVDLKSKCNEAYTRFHLAFRFLPWHRTSYPTTTQPYQVLKLATSISLLKAKIRSHHRI